jgi:hypothetical protein
VDLNQAALLVSIVAVVAAVVEARLLVRADQRAKRADARANAYERRLEAQEQRDQERAQRERRQLALAEAEARASRQARPTTTYRGRVAPGARVYRFCATNIGKGHATDFKAFLIDDTGDIASDEDPPYVGDGGLLMADKSAEFEIAVRPDAVTRNPLFVLLTWNDAGHREEHVSDVEVPVD